MTESPKQRIASLRPLHWITRAAVLTIAALGWPIIVDFSRPTSEPPGIMLFLGGFASLCVLGSVAIAVQLLIAARHRLLLTSIVVLLTVIGVVMAPASFHSHSLPVAVAATLGLVCLFLVVICVYAIVLREAAKGIRRRIWPTANLDVAPVQVPPRRWPQFSLRTLFVVFTALAILLVLASKRSLFSAVLSCFGVTSVVCVGALLGHFALTGWRAGIPLGATIAAVVILARSKVPIPITLVGSLGAGVYLYGLWTLNEPRPPTGIPPAK